MQSLLQEPCISGLLRRKNKSFKGKKQVCFYSAPTTLAGSNSVTTTSTVWVKCKCPKPCVFKSTQASKGTSVEEQMVLLVVANTSLPVGASL